jgi:hypothetical protein
MKYFFSFILLLTIGTACKQKVLSGQELEDKLKETMTEHLHKTLPPGTVFMIKDIAYYPEKLKKVYICTFNVEVHTGNKDTTGTMTAFISNDFKKVDRTQ